VLVLKWQLETDEEKATQADVRCLCA